MVAWKQTLASTQPRESEQDREAILDEIFELILPRLERELGDNGPFLCGQKVSLADLQIYNEVQQIFLIS